MEGRGQVDGDDRVPFLGREILDRGDVLDAGIVDQDVGPPSSSAQRAIIALDLGGLRHVGAIVDRAQLLAFALDLGRRRRSR